MDYTKLNQDFYNSFAAEFSRSREAINPGIARTLTMLDQSAVLDAGCGDGRVRRVLPGECRYVGIDFSTKLIGRAALTPGPSPVAALRLRGEKHAAPFRVRRDGRGESAPQHPRFILADLSAPVPIAPHSFPTVICYAVLHHLPKPNRLPLLQSLARVLRPGGRLALSVWQILHSERMRRKIAQDLGNNDFLLTWKRGGRSLRYVHHFDEDELRGLAEAAGLRVIEMFRSDGHTNDLSLYAVLTI